jgi:hypothetical protein
MFVIEGGGGGGGLTEVKHDNTLDGKGTEAEPLSVVGGGGGGGDYLPLKDTVAQSVERAITHSANQFKQTLASYDGESTWTDLLTFNQQTTADAAIIELAGMHSHLKLQDRITTATDTSFTLQANDIQISRVENTPVITINKAATADDTLLSLQANDIKISRDAHAMIEIKENAQVDITGDLNVNGDVHANNIGARNIVAVEHITEVQQGAQYIGRYCKIGAGLFNDEHTPKVEVATEVNATIIGIITGENKFATHGFVDVFCDGGSGGVQYHSGDILAMTATGAHLATTDEKTDILSRSLPRVKVVYGATVPEGGGLVKALIL